ncbi:hypothetical protein EUX98_g1391 [Antrodiella citrinella]|uniref:Autophagy-related protein 11 n=1 Tax=Antrodiella citrinella TaxID=2447956 RepID=A0A4S4N1M2_9APHY|nr:hypothetical protein EUX98_g1391 [Antrodiella citrinella]
MSDNLIYDILLLSGNVHNATVLYPPTDISKLRELLTAIEESSYDSLKKDCLVYFLLKWHRDERAKQFSLTRSIPPQFVALADAYWALDCGVEVPRAITLLADERINRDYTSKILQAISLSSNPYPLIRKYIRTVKPILSEPDDMDTYALALADSNFLEAWQYQQTFPEGESRSRLLKKLLHWSITPKPRPQPLQQLLGFPFTTFEQSLVHAFAVRPPSSVSTASITAIQDLVCLRLVLIGQTTTAAKLNRQFHTGVSGDSRRGAQERKSMMIDEAVALLPAAERRLLELELERTKDGEGAGSSSSWGSMDLSMSMSWEHVAPSQPQANGAAPKFGRTSDTFMHGPATPISKKSGAPRFGGPISSLASGSGNSPSFVLRRSQVSPNTTTPPTASSSRVKSLAAKFQNTPPERSAESLFDTAGSANMQRNAFYEPPVSAGSKRPLEPDTSHALASSTNSMADASTASASAVRDLLREEGEEDVDMDAGHADSRKMEEPHPASQPDTHDEPTGMDDDEDPRELSFSLFSNNNSRPSRTSNSRPVKAKAVAEEMGPKMPPGAFFADYEDDDEEAARPPLPVQPTRPRKSESKPSSVPVSHKPSRPQEKQPALTRPARDRKSLKASDLGRSLPGSLMDDDDDDDEAQEENETGVAEEHILAYLSDGRRFNNESIRELAGVQDQTIFVFNKAYLDLDMDQVLDRVRVHATLQPQVEVAVSQLASLYLRPARIHADEVDRTLRSLRYQNEALRIASSALDLHVLAIADAFESIASSAQHELDKQSALLGSVEADLEIASRVAIHREFLSETYKKAMDVGQKARTLGDYVSQPKMRQLLNTTAEDLQERFLGVRDTMTRLQEGADDVRAVVADANPLDEAERCGKQSDEALKQLTHLTSIADITSMPEIRQHELAVRGELERLVRVKNSYTERCIATLRQISVLNNYLVELPVAMSSLQSSLRAKTSFSHIQRLHNMLYAYGATLVEVVRRKEFVEFFNQRSQSILEVMAKVSANERKRRQFYRGEVHGQLPFEAKGMDDQVPAVDFTPKAPAESPYSLDRSDVDALMHVLEDLEHFASQSSDPATLTSVREARLGLEKLIGKMDALESGFDRIAERSILSGSRILSNRRRCVLKSLTMFRETTADRVITAIEADDYVYSELEAQIAQLRQEREEREASISQGKQSLEAEISRLHGLLEDSEAARDHLERDFRSTKALFESETTSRRILEQRNAEVCADASAQRTALVSALAEATEQTKEAEMLRQELAQARSDFEDVKALESRNADNISKLLEEQANALRRLDEARARGEDLELQIRDARTESDDVKRALGEASKEKDRLLRAQASEHDRVMRDHIAEADGDRAVLEHQYLELKAALDGMEQELKSARASAETTNSDAVGLREELQRVEHELREARHVERVLREDLRAGRASQSDFELRLENSSRLVAQILDVALSFRESHIKALSAAQTMTAHPPSSKTPGSSSMTDSTSFGMRRSVISHLDEPSPIDPSDQAAALETLRTFDHDHFLEAIHKTGSTIRKWQKQCKDYRERAKGKISFRNFAKGDLALFLPTRNSISKPWAAFNVSFPHYFLQATGHLAEQLKTREWIVARITSLTERVVDPKDPSTNPYGLGDGVKYYMLEVEDWTQPAHPSKRRISHRKTISSEMPTSPTEVAPVGPTGLPEAEVEESFTVTRPPTSRLFPSPPRPGSSPNAPSSLSRLLAQAENSPELLSPQFEKAPFPSTSPPAPPSPARSVSVSTAQDGKIYAAGSSGTLRPGSRASRQSTSSKFSTARIPFAGTAGTAKAIATTALSEQILPTAPGGSAREPAIWRIIQSFPARLTDGRDVYDHATSPSYDVLPASSVRVDICCGTNREEQAGEYCEWLGREFRP